MSDISYCCSFEWASGRIKEEENIQTALNSLEIRLISDSIEQRDENGTVCESQERLLLLFLVYNTHGCLFIIIIIGIHIISRGSRLIAKSNNTHAPRSPAQNRRLTITCCCKKRKRVCDAIHADSPQNFVLLKVRKKNHEKTVERYTHRCALSC